MKKTKIIFNKKIIALLLIVFTLISAINPIFAVSGTGQWAGGQYSSGMTTSDHASNSGGVIIRRLINNSTGERITVFCAEHGVDFATGTIYNGQYATPTNSSIKRACKIAYFGWYSRYGDYVVDGGILTDGFVEVKKAYVYTQQYIWESLGQSNATFNNATYQAEYVNFKNTINNQIADMSRRPSFDATTIEIEAGEEKVLTDYNNVLKDYATIDNTINGIRIQHTYGENTMKITVPSDCTIERINISDNTMNSWGMVKEESKDNDTTIYFSFREGVQNQLYAMNYNDPVPMALSLKINLLGNLELSKVNTNKDLIDGSIFTVSGPGYNGDVEVRNGKILIEKIKKGTYTIKEKSSPDGYLLNSETYTIEVNPNETSYQQIINEEPTGTITIIKKDSETGSVPQGDATLNGAVYKVYASDDIYNKANTKKFYSNGDLVATRTTNENGETEDITNLPLGRYIVKEETAPLGYMLDKNSYNVELNYKDQYTKVITDTKTSLENVKKMGVHIFKSGIKENSGETPGLEGAEFTIKLNSAVEKAYEKGYTYAEVWNGIDENGNQVKVDSKRVSEAQVIAPNYETIKTDRDGNAYTQKNLPYGKYIVKETKTPIDYETAIDFTFSIIDDESEVKEVAKKTKHIVVNNEQLETYIKLIKKDLKSDKLVTLNSTTFEIKATKDIYDRATNKILFKKGEKISQKIGNTTYSSFTTNADNIIVPNNSFNSKNDDKATITTPLKLPVGSYEIIEIKVPTGFLQLDKSVAFEIKNIKDYDTDKDGDFVKEVVIKNEQPTGTIKLDKTIALREDANTSLINTSDLSGIEFRLLAKENIIDMTDGSVIYKKGQEIKKYNLAKDGKLTITNLPMGIYEIEETKTLDGLVLNKTKYEVKFEQKDLNTKVYENKLDISNDTTLVDFSKTDITGDKELIGAKLTVLDNENNIIDTWTSTEKTHKIEGLTVGKEYTLREEIAPDGYVVATSIKFKIEDTNEIQKVNMIDKIVEVTKTDITNGNELEGAELEVVDEDGNTIDKWTSTKEIHTVKGLEEGKTYILKETTAPYGYETTEEIKFTVTTDKETQKIEMKDMPILKSVRVEKIDIDTGEHIKSNKFIFGIYEDEECTKLIKEAGANEFEGTALFEDLRFGTYYIKENKAPLGYSLSDRIVKIEINDNGVFADGKSLEDNDGIYSFAYYNSLLPIIQTGNETNYILLSGIALISLIGIGVTIYLIKKYK